MFLTSSLIKHSSKSKGDRKKRFFPATRKRIIITLPLPPRELSPNARSHWAVKAAATRRYRQWAWAEAVATAGGTGDRWPQATAKATFFFRQRRRRDRDNLLASLKAAFDGLADAGIISDDSGLTHLPVNIDIDRDNPRVEICIERA